MNHTKEAMICKYCGKKMELDDVDFNFTGNKDYYWSCGNCNASAIEKIRYGKSISVEFYKEDNIKRKIYTCQKIK